MKIICNVKHCYAILLKFGNEVLTSLIKLVLEAKASICSTIKKDLLFGICCHGHNLTYIYNKVCITKQDHL